MNDEEIINYFSKWKYIPWARIEQKYKDYLLNRFDDLNIYNDNRTYKEAYFRILNHIEEIPKCPICGQKCKSRIYSYGLSCGNISCSSKIQTKTYLENIHNKYGQNINSYTQLNFVKEKSKQTCFKKYNSSSPLGNRKIWEQTRKTTMEKYGGAYNKEKLNKTLMKKYGVPWFTLSNKLKEKTNTKETQEKQYKTKKKNHSFNISKPENESFKLLKEKYPDVIHQYKDKDRYPFICDFYIPSLDLYIECNYHWTHGGHPYNKDNEEDKLKLKNWEEKNTKFYNNAINTWTIRDINKQNIAKENNLNYLVFYTNFELENWLNNGKSNKKNDN